MNRNVFDDVAHAVVCSLACGGDFTDGDAICEGKFSAQCVGEEVADEGFGEGVLFGQDGVLEADDVFKVMSPKRGSAGIDVLAGSIIVSPAS